MSKLSVIIVNYNVEYFLEQCLHSVKNASANLDIEVFVVDNNSVDGSVEMVKQKFPEVQLICNKKNTGFSCANNQAMRIATGDYLLLLNPDTVVEEDTFIKVISFMDAHPDAGGLGVKMLDGKGNFLPESKRGLPTPMVAFYKIFGLSRIFSKSKIFGRYHLGFLDKDKTHEVDILSGAFMLMRKSVLDKVGLLDEDFFMYGEDIDLSYRIVKGGYKNYYYPETRIIHYKGESTKKSSVNYVFVFYKAMVIFAQKHFSQKNARLFSFLINFAIYLRASVAIASRFAKRAILPLIDTVTIFSGILILKNYWEHSIKVTEGVIYPEIFMKLVVPIYILIWQGAVYLNGGYERPVNLGKIVRGVLGGTAIILIFYALLPETYRFSRALLLLGALWTITVTVLIRLALHFSKLRDFRLSTVAKKRFVIIGNSDETERVSSLLKETNINPSFLGFVSPNEIVKAPNFLGTVDQLTEVIEIYKIDEIIFCSKDLSSQKIIDLMSELGDFKVDFKIAPPESLYLIGSNSIDTSGDLYVVDINSIGKTINKRNKRILDLGISVSVIAALPVLLFLVKKPVSLIVNVALVLASKKSWVGYHSGNNLEFTETKLPRIKPGVLTPADVLRKKELNSETINRLNLLYSKDYRTLNDLHILVKGLRNLDRF